MCIRAVVCIMDIQQCPSQNILILDIKNFDFAGKERTDNEIFTKPEMLSNQ